MGIINNQGVFINPQLGDGRTNVGTKFRDDDDFSVDIFKESIVLPSFPNNIGVAFVNSSDSPANYLTIALSGNNTSTVYINNTSNSANLSVSGDVFIGYTGIPDFLTEKNSYFGYTPSTLYSSDLFVNGRIYAREWSFSDVRFGGVTRFGINTVEINADDNSITGVSTITANVGVITAISGIATITPSNQLNINGDFVVSGISTVGLGTTSNLTVNSTLSFELTSDTNLTIRVRGTDGLIRSANIPLT